MAEVAEESTHVWSSKPRTAMFLAAMRHFALALQAAGRPLHYTRLDAPGNRGSLAAQLQADIERLRPARLVMTAPGDWRVLQAIKAVAEANGLPLDIREDRHFFCSVRRVRGACQGAQVAAHGVLLSRAAQAPPRADGRRRADRRPVELRRRQPRGLRRCRPGRRAAAHALRARCRHARGDRARRHPLRRAPRPAGQLRLAGDARAGAASPCTPSSRSACRCSAATRTRCGRATRGCTTRTCRPRST